VSDGDILATIDGALADYGTSDDAMRWSPDPDKAEQERRKISYRDTPRLYYIAHPDDPEAPTLTEISAAIDMTPWYQMAQIMAVSLRDLQESFQRLVAAFAVSRSLLREQPPPHPRAAGERTASTRRRAGSRRTKRQARRQA
jgi:hypothetical protein